MGAFLYGIPSIAFVIPDRPLAHLKMTIIQKLRRDESFTLSLDGDDHGRESIWLSPSIPLRFAFFERILPALNRSWLNALAVSANSSGGLQLVDEPAEKDLPAVAAKARSSAPLSVGGRAIA